MLGQGLVGSRYVSIIRNPHRNILVGRKVGKKHIHFYGFLQALLEDNGLSDVTMEDAQQLMDNTVKRIKEMDQARKGFQREVVKMDNKGRVMIPHSFRKRLCWSPGEMREVVYEPRFKGVIVK